MQNCESQRKQNKKEAESNDIKSMAKTEDNNQLDLEFVVSASGDAQNEERAELQEDVLQDEQQDGQKDNQPEKKRRKKEKPTDELIYEQLKEQTSEDDDTPIERLSLRKIVGGDHLLILVRHHVWLILLIVFMTTIYVGFRYQCQKDQIEISELEKKLLDAKYKALASSSNLTELCRQSNVLKVLHENNDSLLKISDQPPFIIKVPDEDEN